MKRLLRITVVFFIIFTCFGCQKFNRFDENGLDFDPSEELIAYDGSLYYKQLNNDEKSIFQSLYHACISGSNSFDVGITLNSDYINNAIDAFNYTFPELYWFSNYRYYDYYDYIKVEQTYVDDAIECVELYGEMKTKALEIVDECKTDYQYSTIKNIHDYLIENVIYNIDSNYNQDIRSVFMNNETVCAGFAGAFTYLARLAGFETYCIHGDTTNSSYDNSHLWNVIKIGDDYYYVDVTWDNNEDDENYELGPRYFYFLTSKEIIGNDHFFDERFSYPDTYDASLYFYDEPGIYLDELNKDELTKYIVYWIRSGCNKFYIKCNPIIYQDTYSWLYSDDGFPSIFRDYIDRYSAVEWAISYDDSGCNIEIEYNYA